MIEMRVSTLKRLKRDGDLMPGVVAYDGRSVQAIPLPWRNEAEKALMLRRLKTAFAVAEVKAYAIWSEAWISTVKLTGPVVDVAPLMKPEVMPKDDPSHIDAVVIVGAEKGMSAVMRCWTVTKDHKGRVTKLEPMEGADLMVRGRLGELLGPAKDFDA